MLLGQLAFHMEEIIIISPLHTMHEIKLQMYLKTNNKNVNFKLLKETIQ